ncbi:MAG: selenide, water dikinase SelD [Sneathiellaceae bacterium]
MHDIVLLGGGHAHVEVLRAFGMRPEPGLRLTVISRDVHTPYSGMLPGLIAGHYDFDEAHIDLAPLCRFAGARLYRDSAVRIDPAARLVHCAERPPVRFDTLSIDTGATPSFAGAAGAMEFAIPVKPIDRFAARWAALRKAVLGSCRAPAIGVAGAGAGGVELLLSARHAQRTALLADGGDPDRLAFHLLSAGADVLPATNRAARRIFRGRLEADGVALHDRFQVAQVQRDGVVAADGRRVAVDHLLWVTSAAAAAWPRDSGLACTADGFIRVDDRLRSLSHPGIFAAGDIATMDDAPRPKAGVFAVRQGPPLAENLRAAATGRPLRRFRPQRHPLGLISTGPRHAVAVRGPFAIHGDWVWRWKDRIDRRFMRRYGDLPAMPEAEGEAEMRCAGCGAKIGHAALVEGLSVPPGGDPADWDAAAWEDAARLPGGAAARGDGAGGTWASIDGFRLPVDDPWRSGRIAVHHAMSDLHAMGVVPSAALVFAVLPHMPADKQAEELRQLMAGVRAALAEEGAELAGGHTAEGLEPMLALTVTGSLPAGAAPWRKTGLRPGDSLLLTRPIGTGILLAAAMRGRAKGRWWLGALEAMSQSQSRAAGVLRRFEPSAVTDVTGYGLGGHLADLLQASGMAAELRLAEVPLLPGAAEMAASGIASSALPAGRAGFPAVALALEDALSRDPADGPRPPAWWRNLLFDPQTGGGLLVGLAPDRVPPALAALRAVGCDAAAIGRVIDPGAEGLPGPNWGLRIR